MEVNRWSDPDEALERLKVIRNDPYEFAKGVRTLDESDEENPIKTFPVHLTYIKLYIRIWQRTKLMVVPKSRRMRMSWTNIMLFVWDAMFHQGKHLAFVSKKEDDANFLLESRALFIIKNLDPNVIPIDLLPKWEFKYCLITFPEIHSRIQGFPQGADQMRQFTLSGILADEFAFWDKAEDMYSSSKPTLEGGGRFTGISSPAPGFFKRLVTDQLNREIEVAGEQQTANKVEHHKPMIGMELWKNEKNRFTVVQIHYTADPAKRSEEWKDKEKSGMPIKKWNQEYELKWESYTGVPVYTDFSKELHGTTERMYPHLGLPLLRGWDFGLMPACVIAQLQEDTLVILKEFTATNMGIDRFSDIVIPQCRQLYPNWGDQKEDWMDFIDPSGNFRNDNDETTCAQLLSDKGLQPIPGAVVWEKRRKSVEDFLVKLKGGQSCFKIDITNCPTLMAGFNGGYRYPDNTLELEPGKIRPLKDVHSHPHDALQMITTCINMLLDRHRSRVPRQSYQRRGRNRR